MTTATTKDLAKPIIFTGESVRGILRDAKTQTRRVLKHQPHYSEGHKCWFLPCGRATSWMSKERTEVTNRATGSVAVTERDVPLTEFLMEHCPYSVGDRLYVKETFYVDHADYAAGEKLPSSKPDWWDDSVYFPADANSKNWCCDLIPECCCAEVGKPRARSPLFMPRWASRITLEIIGLTVERVQSISEDDAIAEGCSGRNEFIERWNEINGKTGRDWASNCWVWCLAFKRVEGE